MGLLDKLLRAGEGRKLKGLQGIVPEIEALEAEMAALSDAGLAGKTDEFRNRYANGEDINEILIEAFATVREAARREIGQFHYPVQLMGGAALHFGWIAEMRTGEGKTLVSTLPAYLNGVTGKGVHLITVNDYLASRDAEWMGRIHRRLGLTVGLVVPSIDSKADKRKAYAADITYGTNNEFGFDYLRDNMAMSLQDKVQRGHNFAIVDEVDSILIDEARTPLIISGRLSEAAQLYQRFSAIVRTLVRDEDYEVDEEKRAVAVTEEGIDKVEQQLGIENLYDEFQTNLVHQLQVALKAKELYKRDKDYIIRDNEVLIVDEFTGRTLPGRRWSDGIHQAVEAKEGVKIKEENQTLATITLQNYFRLYDKLSGMTGTAVTEAGEFAHTYDLAVVPIPTNKPTVRVDQQDLIYKTENAKFEAVVNDIGERIEGGQPVLVGTASVEHSEVLSKLLDRRGIAHNVLNAKQHAREAEVVAQAGRIGSVTVATNMAGRGVDILLGGNPEGLAAREVRAEGLDPQSDEGAVRYAELLPDFERTCKEEGVQVREVGGLYVLGTERHESRRIDNQLRGRSGRQGDLGESRFYLSLEDDLMRLFATGALSWVMGRTFPDDQPIEAKMVSKAIERAQTTVEQRNAEIRKNVLKYDEVLNAQRKVVYNRRDQILSGDSLRDESLEILKKAVAHAVDVYLVEDLDDEWDFDGLLAEVQSIYSTQFNKDDLVALRDPHDISAALLNEAIEVFEQREEENDPELLRDVERRVMLSILDQRWREHLYEMDYLQDGIHLRAISQADPLVEWQREGFNLFSSMLDSVEDDYIKTLMHVQIKLIEEEPASSGSTLGVPVGTNIQYSAPEDPSAAAGLLQSAAASPIGSSPAEASALPRPRRTEAPSATIKRSDQEKIGRNDPCYCGSGKKYKLCHGRK